MYFASAGQADVSGESYGTNKTRKPVKLEIMNLLFVALKGPLPGQWGVWGLQNDEGNCWQNITSGFLCRDKQLNLKSVLERTFLFVLHADQRKISQVHQSLKLF